MAEGTMIDMGDGFGGMSILSGGAGFVGGLVLGSHALDLTDSRYTDIQMINTAVNRGTKLLNGKITKQDIVDIGAIGLALILRRI